MGLTESFSAENNTVSISIYQTLENNLSLNMHSARNKIYVGCSRNMPKGFIECLPLKLGK